MPNNVNPSGQRVALAKQWFDMNKADRLNAGLPTSMREFSRYIGIGTTKLYEMRTAYLKGNITKGLKELNPDMKFDDEEFDPQKWLNETRRERYEAVLKTARGGNASAQKLLAQLAGELVEKSEEKLILELSADEIARRNEMAEAELREFRATRLGIQEVSG